MPGRRHFLHLLSELGLRVAREAFADRAYQADGQLVSRQHPAAVLHDVSTVVSRAVGIATRQLVATHDGSPLHLEADTICIHSDTPGSDRLAAAVRVGLETAGVAVRAAGMA